MYDADAIEAINFEQLATITDRLLLRSSRRPSRLPAPSPAAPHAASDRFSIPSLAPLGRAKSTARVSPLLAAAPSLPRVPSTPLAPSSQRLARGSQLHIEPTDLVRSPLRAASTPAARGHRFAVVVVIPALLGAALGLAAML